VLTTLEGYVDTNEIPKREALNDFKTTLVHWLRLEAAAALNVCQQTTQTIFLQGPLSKVLGPWGWLPLQQQPTQRKWQPSSKQIYHAKKKRKLTVLTYVVNHSLNLVTNIQLHGSQAHHIKALINNMNLLISCPKVAGGMCVSTKLGSVDSGSVGSANCGWLPTRLAMPDQHATQNPDHNRECNPNNSRGSRTAIQRGSCRDSAFSRKLCVPDIPGGEEGIGIRGQ